MQEAQVWSLGQGRSPRVGNDNPLQYSYLENSMDRGSLAGYSPWGLQRVGHHWATEQTDTHTHTHTHTHTQRRILRHQARGREPPVIVELLNEHSKLTSEYFRKINLWNHCHTPIPHTPQYQYSIGWSPWATKTLLYPVSSSRVP